MPSEILEQLYPNEVIMVGGRIVIMSMLIEGADFKTIYGPLGLGDDLEKLWIPVAQSKAFCKEYPNKMCKAGATIFLHKKDETKSATPRQS